MEISDEEIAQMAEADSIIYAEYLAEIDALKVAISDIDSILLRNILYKIVELMP